MKDIIDVGFYNTFKVFFDFYSALNIIKDITQYFFKNF